MPTIHERSWKMLPFVASQAVALSQAKRDASKASATSQHERHAPDGQRLLCNAARRRWSSLAGVGRQWRYGASVACTVRVLDK